MTKKKTSNTPELLRRNVKLLKLPIEGFDFLGRGFLRFENRNIFVPGAFPGDLVEISISGDPGDYEITEVIKQCPDRIKSDCAYFGPCQGCDLLELSEKGRKAAKIEILRVATGSFCGDDKVTFHPFQSSPKKIRYMHRVRIHRGKKGERSESGFLPSFDSHEKIRDGVVAVNSCALLDSALQKRLVLARKALSEADFPVDAIYLASSPVEPDIVTAHLCLNAKSRISQVKPFAEKVLKLVNLKGLSFGRPEKGVEGVVGEVKLAGLIAPGAPKGPYFYEPSFFCQANVDQNKALIDSIVKLGNIKEGIKIAEGFAGAGNFSIPLAALGAEVEAFESHPGAIRMGIKNIIKSGLKDKIKLNQADAFKALSKIQFSPDILLIDPPRNGVPQIGEVLKKTAPKRVFYISCDMKALARDGQSIVRSGYKVTDISGFDFFPRTHHVEVLVIFEKMA
ncbi:MAG: class I SAM-dependent RNA methyltransferase [Candidatus Riflebacteria bacterium]|nr:class I SAM-dependent RNA methyltransferase [Candidatus Riflebacteria bacterium]